VGRRRSVFILSAQNEKLCRLL